MKNVSRISLTVLLSLSLAMLFFGCSKETEKMERPETLKLAAREFQPDMANLGKVLNQGDFAEAKETLANLKEKFIAIQQAEIPERLAESSEKIKSQIETLATSMDEFSTALSQPGLSEIDSTILKNYDMIRINFARLGALLRVKIPELVSFHDALYTLWHDYYPNEAIDSIKAIVPEFKEKAAALENIQWPEVLSNDVDALNAGVRELQAAVNELEAVCQGDDAEAIKKATIVVHDKYKDINMML